MLAPRRQARLSLALCVGDDVGRNVEVAVIVEGVTDGDHHHGDEGEITSHHMYQTMAKAKTTLIAPRMTPVPVFFGMWIGLKPASGGCGRAVHVHQSPDRGRAG